MTTFDALIVILERAIEERRTLMHEMVGTLYPQVLRGEIEKLQQAMDALRRT